jgi:hypothetical protein
MSDIGGVSVDILRGIPQLQKSRVELWQVAGLDGYGAQVLGLGDAEFLATGILYVADQPSADVFFDAINALQGTVVSLTDDFAVSYSGILVVHVQVAPRQPVIKNGNPNAVRCQVDLRCVSI